MTSYCWNWKLIFFFLIKKSYYLFWVLFQGHRSVRNLKLDYMFSVGSFLIKCQVYMIVKVQPWTRDHAQTAFDDVGMCLKHTITKLACFAVMWVQWAFALHGGLNLNWLAVTGNNSFDTRIAEPCCKFSDNKYCPSFCLFKVIDSLAPIPLGAIAKIALPGAPIIITGCSVPVP